MITWTQFVRYYAANHRRTPRVIARDVKHAGRARYLERVRSGYADSVLDFGDLVEAMETAIGGAA